MKLQNNKHFSLSLIFIGVLAVLLLLFFIPDMGTTLINTVPEFPPQTEDIMQGPPAALNLVSVDKANVKNVVAAMARPSEYYSETQSVLSHKGGSATYFRRTWVKNGWTRIDIMNSSNSSPSMHYLYGGGDVYIWRPYDRTYYKTKEGSQSADDSQMMMTYEDIISAADENIITAQYTQYDGLQCIYAEIRDPLLSYTERYWVSSSTGLLVYGQTLDESGSVIYTISATRTEVSPQSSEHFTLPDGKRIFEN